MRAAPAPAYCLRLDTNVFFYLHVPPRCLDLHGHGHAYPPVWLLIPNSAVTEFARLRPDLDVRIVVDGLLSANLPPPALTRNESHSEGDP